MLFMKLSLMSYRSVKVQHSIASVFVFIFLFLQHYNNKKEMLLGEN